MEKVVYNPIMDKNYIGIVTVLDYETSVRKCLSSVLVGTQNRMERKVIVDLALKVGVNEYRFVVYDICTHRFPLGKRHSESESRVRSAPNPLRLEH